MRLPSYSLFRRILSSGFRSGTGQARLPGGHRTGAPGKHVIGGKAKYRLVDEKVRVYVAPPIEVINASPVRPHFRLHFISRLTCSLAETVRLERRLVNAQRTTWAAGKIPRRRARRGILPPGISSVHYCPKGEAGGDRGGPVRVGKTKCFG